MRYASIYDAVHAWVSEMVSLPLSVAEKLKSLDEDDFEEFTPPVRGDCVYFPFGGDEGEVVRYDPASGRYLVRMNGGYLKSAAEDEIEVYREEFFPMWGTLWSFSDPCDIRWGEEHLQQMADCGFRLYESEDYGLVFGIDGAGYDFYREHWIPLYRTRGLQWHKEAVNV